jgi:hypothetical protein
MTGFILRKITWQSVDGYSQPLTPCIMKKTLIIILSIVFLVSCSEKRTSDAKEGYRNWTDGYTSKEVNPWCRLSLFLFPLELEQLE